MYRIGLNLNKKDNFKFFDFDAPLCLDLQKTVGVVVRPTPNVLRGIKSGVLLDYDNLLGFANGEVETPIDTNKEVEIPIVTEEPKVEEVVTEEVKVEEVVPVVPTEPEVKPTGKGKGRGKNKKEETVVE